ncbi:putative N-acetylmannosamine-6-phosphate 2-epimerase [Devosia pacifica]|uniref:Putative N-acetylmannosamine-6-phosphate 2-epimerase n=1 Tax=Devosia pacifica TaxID=1335967 RepID=A0A918SED4_9HYPH|nr:N-acetylmannosamine-6-phosphate 2-epimerase [Devosia pacifica]GHA34752.1 putative N-acetylmannosamine-6-phosphate 2-epimerase [Devosia pacifica]
MTTLIEKGGLIVSCQAREDNPLHGPMFMAAMALAARDGGACAIRANGPEDVKAVKATGLPVIGIHKVFDEASPVYITPTIAAAEALSGAGADIIALDCTMRQRSGDPADAIIQHVRDTLGLEVFADVSTLEEGMAAASMGATYVATTLSGYTDASAPKPEGPDLALIAELSARIDIPVVAEGRFNTPELARAAIDAGAHAVVVGTMITNPREITRSFARRVLGH